MLHECHRSSLARHPRASDRTQRLCPTAYGHRLLTARSLRFNESRKERKRHRHPNRSPAAAPYARVARCCNGHWRYTVYTARSVLLSAIWSDLSLLIFLLVSLLTQDIFFVLIYLYYRPDAQECWMQIIDSLKDVLISSEVGSATQKKFVRQYMTTEICRE